MSPPADPDGPEIPSLLLTPAQRMLLGSSGAPPGRHWEQAVWPEFSGERFRDAVAQIAAAHPHSRATREGGSQRFAPAPPGPDPFVILEDGATLEAGARRERITAAASRLCLAAPGGFAPAWQAHVMRLDTGAAVITVAFVRAFFDRRTIVRLLGDLVSLYHDRDWPAPGDTHPLEAFAVWADLCSANAEPAPDPAPTVLGPDILPHPGPPSMADALAHRTSIRLDAAAWTCFCDHLASVVPTASRDAAVFAAAARVLAMWSAKPCFGVVVTSDGRTGLPASADAAGQFDRNQVITVDETTPRTLQEAVATWRDALASPSPESVVPAPAVVFSFLPTHSVHAPNPYSSERFVFIGSTHPDAALEMQAEETPDGALVVHFDHQYDGLEAWRIEEIAGALEATLRRAASGLDAWRQIQAADVWEVLPANQRLRRHAVNATHGPVTDDLLTSGFLRTVAAEPGRLAVASPSRRLTYAELYGVACRLALDLQARDVRPNELVAVLAPKGWEQVAATLGILMAGAAYLPIDSDLPAERIRHLLASGEARFVIATSRECAETTGMDGVEMLAVDALEPVPPGTPPPACRAQPTDLAYVIFTSGSTGAPKGVMIEHRGAVNTIEDMNARFGIGADDRVLALSRLGFDLSVYDIFGVLAAGGTIVLPAPELARDPSHWLELVREHGVTVWNTVPALMHLFVDYVVERAMPHPGTLRHVWLSGDWIPLNLPDAIHAVWPRAAVTSLGGATEASIWSIMFPIARVDPAWRSIPYGRPMRNQTFHVLHPNLAPCPDGVPGELYIGGMGLARGYWKDPERSAARFPVHPLSGERLYRTGDLGRYRPDGDIEFLGRVDFQIKIRGFRIEPGEVESALTCHPDVRAAVVVAHGRDDMTRRLIAHVAGPDPRAGRAEELRGFLRTRLPEYMIPAHIVFHEKLPLTINGKVDLKALPVPGESTDASRPAPAAPANEIESILLQEWRALLGIEHLGVDDDFFAVGGTSLTGTRLVMRLRTAFSLPLPVHCLVEHPTVRRLGRVIEERLLAELADDCVDHDGHPPAR